MMLVLTAAKAVAGETMTAGDATIMKMVGKRAKTMAAVTSVGAVAEAAEVPDSQSQRTARSKSRLGRSASLSRPLQHLKKLETISRTKRHRVGDVVAAIADNATMMVTVLLARMQLAQPSTATSASTMNTAKTRNREEAELVAVAVEEAAKKEVTIRMVSQMLTEARKKLPKVRTAVTSRTVEVVAARDVVVTMQAVAVVAELVVAIDAAIIKTVRQVMGRQPLVTMRNPTCRTRTRVDATMERQVTVAA